MLVVLPGSGLAQNGAQSTEQPCIAKDETIYTPGEDHVKLPALRRERIGPDNKGRIRPNSHVALELTVNASGDICEVRALKAPSREEATAVAEYVADSFRFKPATRNGKPVAVRFQVLFNFFP
jgi:hypothetical protein